MHRLHARHPAPARPEDGLGSAGPRLDAGLVADRADRALRQAAWEERLRRLSRGNRTTRKHARWIGAAARAGTLGSLLAGMNFMAPLIVQRFGEPGLTLAYSILVPLFALMAFTLGLAVTSAWPELAKSRGSRPRSAARRDGVELNPPPR